MSRLKLVVNVSCPKCGEGLDLHYDRHEGVTTWQCFGCGLRWDLDGGEPW